MRFYTLKKFFEEYRAEAPWPITENLAALLMEQDWLLTTEFTVDEIAQCFPLDEQKNLDIHSAYLPQVLQQPWIQELLGNRTYLIRILMIKEPAARVCIDPNCHALILDNINCRDQFLTLHNRLSDLLLDPAARQDLQLCDMALLLRCNKLASQVLHNTQLRREFASKAFRVLEDPAFRQMTQKEARALRTKAQLLCELKSLWHFFHEVKVGKAVPATSRLKEIFRDNPWLLDLTLTAAEFKRYFSLNEDNLYDIRADVVSMIKQAWVQDVLQKSPIYFITILNIVPSAVAVCTDKTYQTLIDDNRHLLNQFLSLADNLSQLLLDPAARHDLQLCNIALLLRCNESAAQVLRNRTVRRLLANDRFALLENDIFTHMSPVQAEALLSETALQLPTVAYLTYLLQFSATHSLAQATEFAQWLRLPLIQKLLSQGVITSNSYSEPYTELWQFKNAIWQKLTPESQAALDLRYFLKLPKEFENVTPDLAAQFLNDESFRVLLQNNKISLSALTELYSSHAAILETFKTKLNDHNCHEFVKRDQLIECLLAYVNTYTTTSGKIPMVEALINDLQHGASDTPIWKNGFDRTFGQGRLDSCLCSLYPHGLPIDQVERFLTLPPYPSCVAQTTASPPNARSAAVISGLSTKPIPAGDEKLLPLLASYRK